MRKRALKVFGGQSFSSKGFVRTIIAAASQKEAAAIIGTSMSDIRDYWSITGNKTELSVAMSKPMTVFMASTSMGSDFVERKRKRNQ